MRRLNFVIFSALLFVFAAVYIAWGSIMAFNVHKLMNIAREIHIYYPLLLMVLCGIFGFSTSLLFLFSALLKRNYIIGTTVVFLAFVFIGSFTSAILSGFYFYKSNVGIINSMTDEMNHYDNVSDKRQIDYIQEKFSCCGLKSFSDWNSTKYYKENSYYPPSCYLNQTVNGTWENTLYTNGCYDYIYNWFRKRFIELISTTGIISIILFLELLFLLSEISKKSQYNYSILDNPPENA